MKITLYIIYHTAANKFLDEEGNVIANKLVILKSLC